MYVGELAEPRAPRNEARQKRKKKSREEKRRRVVESRGEDGGQGGAERAEMSRSLFFC